MTNQIKIQDDILSYREMCDAENIQTLQRGLNFRMNPSYSVILMSQRSNAPYRLGPENGLTINRLAVVRSRLRIWRLDHISLRDDRARQISLTTVF